MVTEKNNISLKSNAPNNKNNNIKKLSESPWLDLAKFENAESFPFSVSMLTWALDEEESIEEFLMRAQLFMQELGVPEFEHILIDDGSTDRTFEIASEFQKKYPQLKIVKNKKNLGPGWCTRIAVSHATKDILFWQMADWSYDISQLKNYIQYFRNYDVIQGVRIPPKTLTTANGFKKRHLLTIQHFLERSDNKRKAFVSIANYLLIRILFRIPLLDYQNVTIYPRKLAQSLKLESSSPFTNPEMLFKSYWKGARIKQVSIGFHARQKGEAKGTRWVWLRKASAQVIGFWWKWVVLRRRPDFKQGSITLP